MATYKKWPRDDQVPGGDIAGAPAEAGEWIIAATNGDGESDWMKVTGLNFASFVPTFAATESGGDFSGQSIVEKGYDIPIVGLAWASNDPVSYPIADSDTLLMGGAPIDLDGETGTGGSVGGGLYTDPGGLTEAEEGVGFSVNLIDDEATNVVKNASINWRYRMFHLVHSQATPDASWLADVISGVNPSTNNLRTGRTGTFSFSPTSQYAYFAYPQAFGVGTFLFNGNPTTFIQTAIISVVNQYGLSIDWYVYRSNQLLTGSGIEFEVQ